MNYYSQITVGSFCITVPSEVPAVDMFPPVIIISPIQEHPLS